MVAYNFSKNRKKILDIFYLIRGFPHGYVWHGIRTAFYDNLVINFPIEEDPAFDDVWLRQVYYPYIPKPNDVVIDVGAHMGFFALKIVKSVKKIIAVEPDPANFKFLSSNVQNNKFDNKIIFHNIALGGKDGTVFLDRTGYGYGRSKPTENKTDLLSKMRTLDDLINQEKLVEISLIKIDTEGFELNVLQGSTRSLRNYKPNLIIAAYHFPQEHVLISDFLKKQGYTTYFYYMPLFLSGKKEIYIYGQKRSELELNE
jgi:FkbM family methyltransferase